MSSVINNASQHPEHDSYPIEGWMPFLSWTGEYPYNGRNMTNSHWNNRLVWQAIDPVTYFSHLHYDAKLTHYRFSVNWIIFSGHDWLTRHMLLIYTLLKLKNALHPMSIMRVTECGVDWLMSPLTNVFPASISLQTTSSAIIKSDGKILRKHVCLLKYSSKQPKEVSW